MDEEKRSNQNYEIIESCTIGSTELVIGHNPNAPKHIQKAEQGIRFIDPQYKELFRIPDGGKVIVTTSRGEKREYPCRFIDEYHTEVGSNLYHICEFAERMQKNGATYEPKPAEQTPQKTPKHKDLER